METDISDTNTEAASRQHSNNKFAANSIMSCVRKVLEIIIADKIQHYLQHNNLWPEHQKGFKKGSSAIHSIGTLIIDIQIAMIKHEKLEAIFSIFKRHMIM